MVYQDKFDLASFLPVSLKILTLAQHLKNVKCLLFCLFKAYPNLLKAFLFNCLTSIKEFIHIMLNLYYLPPMIKFDWNNSFFLIKINRLVILKLKSYFKMVFNNFWHIFSSRNTHKKRTFIKLSFLTSVEWAKKLYKIYLGW